MPACDKVLTSMTNGSRTAHRHTLNLADMKTQLADNSQLIHRVNALTELANFHIYEFDDLIS